MKISLVGASLVLLALLPGAAAVTGAPAATSPIASSAPLQVSGLSVEAKRDPFGKGFDFAFRSDTNSTTTMSLDPLGYNHSASGSISSSAGSITLNGRYNRNDREITIVAKRGGQEVGRYSWRVEASLR